MAENKNDDKIVYVGGNEEKEALMNDKAEQWIESLEKVDIKDWFNIQPLNDELKTVLFRTSVEINGQSFPILIQTDESLCMMFMGLINEGAVNDGNRAELIELANKFNSMFKVFKYVVVEDRIEIHSFVFAKEEDFDPDTVHVLIEQIAKNLEETYGEWMKVIWKK